MTVADMIAQRKIALDCILNDSNNAISAKGGTPADNLSGLQDAIVSIPSGGVLPELTTPAEVGHVLAGKEYIDGNGNKQTGTLVVCDTVAEVDTFGSSGVGLEVEIESSADGSASMLTLPEPNLKPENIVAGSSIFGVQGSAKTLRVETGTITPAEDITAIDIACTTGYKLFVFKMTSGSASGKARWKEIYCTPGIAPALNGTRNANARYLDANGNIQYGILSASADNGFGVLSTAIVAAAGCEYTWAAYYWEDT